MPTQKPDMSKVLPGDLLFFRDNTLISRAIRLCSTGKYGQDVPSHVGIALRPCDNFADHLVDYVMLEATWTVREGKVSTRPNATIWIMRFTDPKDVEAGLKWAREQVGKGYDYTALVGIWLRSFTRLLGPAIYAKSKTVRNFLDSKTRFFCSEYGWGYGKVVKNHAPYPSDPSETTPFDLIRSADLIEIQKTGRIYAESDSDRRYSLPGVCPGGVRSV
jgi:hypothetical protein